jgi:hypothetical protein
MKTNIATDSSQSQRLLRCGVSADTADMARYEDDEVPMMPWDWTTGSYGGTFPAWSLNALLGLLPKEIDIDGYKYRISIYFESSDEPVIGNQWCLYYKPKKHNEKSHYIDDVPMYATDLIECAVLMIEWLIRHNYKLNKQ